MRLVAHASLLVKLESAKPHLLTALGSLPCGQDYRLLNPGLPIAILSSHRLQSHTRPSCDSGAHERSLYRALLLIRMRKQRQGERRAEHSESELRDSLTGLFWLWPSARDYDRLRVMDAEQRTPSQASTKLSPGSDEPALRHDIGTESLTRFAWLSIAAALTTILLKTGAYFLTGSVGLLSDAVESLVNLVGGVMALAMLTVAARPADEDHAYGHTKAEYFSSGVEGGLIVLAAVSIAYAAVQRLLHPKALQEIGLGLAVSALASLINLAVALLLRSVGRRRNSVTLEANAQHLLTDVWTSVGVVVGVGAVALTGFQSLDPIVALLVAGNIVWTGLAIVLRSTSGLMDTALSAQDQARVRQVLEMYEGQGVQFHALRTRQSGARKFLSVHVLVPGDWTVQHGHELLERIETEMRRSLPGASLFTHLEPLDDPASWADEHLDPTTTHKPRS
jgi:cation diffusion facilitator family transporter